MIKFLNIPAVLYQSQQATEDRSSCLDVLHQNSISNKWFEYGCYLSAKEATLGILSDKDFVGEDCLAGQPLRIASESAMTTPC